MSHWRAQPSKHTKKQNLTCISRLDTHDLRRRLRATNSKTQSHLHFAPSTRTISAEGCAGQNKNASHLHFAPSTRTISAEGCRTEQKRISPAFRAFDTHGLRRGLRATGHNAISPAVRAFDTHDLRRGLHTTGQKRNLTCIWRLRHARSPQRVARDRIITQSHLHFAPSARTISAEGCARPDKTQSHLHFAPSTCTISAEGCAGPNKNAISPAFRAFDTHDLRRGLTFVMLRHHPRLKRELKEEREDPQM